jgi:diadenosine tetraphosphatase ApaH/serine/threonine PP2A family protein phosphatase
LAKYDQEVYDLVMDLFDNLPLSAIINNKFLCIHGGISTDIQSVRNLLNRLLKLKKFKGRKKFPSQGYFAT